MKRFILSDPAVQQFLIWREIRHIRKLQYYEHGHWCT